MDVRKRQPIGIELVKKGIVTEADIDEALQEQKQNPDKKLKLFKIYTKVLIIIPFLMAFGVIMFILIQSRKNTFGHFLIICNPY